MKTFILNDTQSDLLISALRALLYTFISHTAPLSVQHPDVLKLYDLLNEQHLKQFPEVKQVLDN